ncbi:hypothetical protein [Variovorax sp. UMC13]|uniref:hypothetical protein n=1 Tax=Variovorax sp. UMC13 TaxID=1862326 RepID=UPI0015FF88D8|nr:hypothetical protein [Variovorax sp. UMC13]
MAKKPEPTPERLAATTRRNLAHLQRAILNYEVMRGLELAKGAPFAIHVIHASLKNDYLANCMKVFEDTRKVATFWSVLAASPHVTASLNAEGMPVDEIRAVAAGLKVIRDRTHFHIGAESVEAPADVWKDAGLTGDRLYRSVLAAWRALNFHQAEAGREPLSVPDIDKEALKRMVEFVREQ